MRLTKEQLVMIREDIDKSLAEIAERYALAQLKCGNATFNANSFTMKIEGGIAGAPTKEEMNYMRYAMGAGITAPLHSVIALGSNEYEITGMRVGGPHKSVLMKNLANQKGAKLKLASYKIHQDQGFLKVVRMKA